jgi:hypothetical protein
MSNLRLVKNGPPTQSTSIDTRYPPSITETIDSLGELTQLDDNWDSYGALRPTTKAIHGAITLVMDLFEEGTPIPDVFPMPNGNLQIEWSCFGLDLEIEVISNRKCIASFDNLVTGESWEEEFTFNLTKLRSVVADLTFRNIHSNHLHAVNA